MWNWFSNSINAGFHDKTILLGKCTCNEICYEVQAQTTRSQPFKIRLDGSFQTRRLAKLVWGEQRLVLDVTGDTVFPKVCLQTLDLRLLCVCVRAWGGGSSRV